MRIVIDLQGSQAVNKNRGIGRYCLSLTKAIARNAGQHEIIVALSDFFPEEAVAIRDDLGEHLPQKNIKVWSFVGAVSAIDPHNKRHIRSAELVREAFLSSLNPDVIHVMSMFEGYIDNAVTSIGIYDSITPVCVSCFDLIPLLNQSQYLEPNPGYKTYYTEKLTHLNKATMLLAISDASRQEAIDHLSFSDCDVINGSLAAEPHFQKCSIKPKQKKEIFHKYGIDCPYVMYTGGIDFRKNIEGLIRSYSALTEELRKKHQLLIVCSIQAEEEARLKALGKKYGLKDKELIFTGYVSDSDLVLLYNLCTLFIFPSLHEGFGLPLLEAMSCGVAVIGSNNSSIPEVIGRDDALFDAKDDRSITDKLREVLLNKDFRSDLAKHGLIQASKFTWKATAKIAIDMFEKARLKRKNIKQYNGKKKLAYVSPLYPEKSGISNYSSTLIPFLSEHYDICLIVEQEIVTDDWVNDHCEIHGSQWLLENRDNVDRVLYHFGNSKYHTYMFDLIRSVPGVVVLHDFYLSGAVSYGSSVRGMPEIALEELIYSHGYSSLISYFNQAKNLNIEDRWEFRYPCNLNVIEQSLGVITHSQYAKELITDWYGINEKIVTIPHLGTPIEINEKMNECLLKKEFLVCSFGLLGETKQSMRLLEAWIASGLSNNPYYRLVFVGKNDEGNYGDEISRVIKKYKLETSVKITGWVDNDEFDEYLARCDVAVQLRTLSRGETSGAVLHCMNHGIATIVNANGGMAELPDNAVCKIDDEFDNAELIAALEMIVEDERYRKEIGHNAREMMISTHAPKTCAESYFDKIEGFYSVGRGRSLGLISSIQELEGRGCDEGNVMQMAAAIAQSICPEVRVKQLFVDISELVVRDGKSGIQRVVKSVLKEWLLKHPGDHVRVEPVYSEGSDIYRYARQFSMNFLGYNAEGLYDSVIDFREGDIFLGLDLQPTIVVENENFYQKLRCHGVLVKFIVYDLLCVLMPQYFVAGAEKMFTDWLNVVAKSDGVICISKTVSVEFESWLTDHELHLSRDFSIEWFHLGVDEPVNRLLSKKEVFTNKRTLNINGGINFLMVGTLEPRKAHAQVLSAFEILWNKGAKVNLVIVGKKGWLVDELSDYIRTHPLINERLIWIDDANDVELNDIYDASHCLVVASEGEGFGLPIIEAGRKKIPIIARDIPVFREVASENAYYFSGHSPEKITCAVSNWMLLYEANKHPAVGELVWGTWKESSQELFSKLNIILN